MSQVPSNLLYTKEHEWVEVIAPDRVRVGITDFAQDQLGDIVFIELPAVGSSIKENDSIGSVESVKTVSDIFSPVSGKVVSVNGDLETSPENVNEQPYGAGWMLEVEISGPDALSQLLSPEQYQNITNGNA
jgi:glycine cleavage system H protein